jgi:25S rRNA (adenine2142-N1)-methyltransferase
MASEEHLKLSTTIKSIHKNLRTLSSQIGAEEAWREHLKDEETLKIYAYSMRALAEEHWKNSHSDDRIQWSISYCDKYFQHDQIDRWVQKDLRTIEMMKKHGIEVKQLSYEMLSLDEKLDVLDVGSSGNFFKNCQKLNVLPIDISPSHESVHVCDFLSVAIENQMRINERKVETLPKNHFHVVIFCLLLEYLPSSTQRIKCCEKAYETLRTNGILIIITPDSNHEMKNSKQIKNWRWTLAKIGFQRIKLEKLTNLTCMAFRKNIAKEIPISWADQHKEPNFEFELLIPQDKLKTEEESEKSEPLGIDMKILLNELPNE